MNYGLPFIPALLDDLGLDARAFRVFCRIVRRAGAGGTCFESIRNMAAALGLWRPNVTRAVKELSRLGLVSIEARGEDRAHLRPASQRMAEGRLRRKTYPL